jgi:hypothetical protein
VKKRFQAFLPFKCTLCRYFQGALGAVMQRNIHDIGLGGEWDDEPTTGGGAVQVESSLPVA